MRQFLRTLAVWTFSSALVLVACGLWMSPMARAEWDLGTMHFRLYILEVHKDSGPSTVVGAVVATGSSNYTDANSNVWAANSQYWFWDSGPAWPTGNPDGDDGFRMFIAADQGDITDYDPDLANYIYDNGPFTTFIDDVGIVGGTKRFKVWRVPNSGSNVLIGFLKEFEPSYNLSWYGFESQVNVAGKWMLGASDSHFWLEPTSSTFNEDAIAVEDLEPR